MYKYIAATGKFDIDLDAILQNYNSQWHRSLPKRMSPLEAAKPENHDAVYDHLYTSRWRAAKNQRFKLYLGQKVRTAKFADKLSKGYKFAKWSTDIYTIKVSQLLHLPDNRHK